MATTNMFYSHERIFHRDNTEGNKQLQAFHGVVPATGTALATPLLFHGLLPPKLKPKLSACYN